MPEKLLTELSDKELQEKAEEASKVWEEITRRQVEGVKKQVSELEETAGSLFASLKGIFDDVSEDVKDELTKHVAGLPNLSNVTKGTSILKQQAKVPTKTRRKWSDDEKKKIVAELNTEGMTVAKLSREYEITPKLIYAWVKKYEGQS